VPLRVFARQPLRLSHRPSLLLAIVPGSQASSNGRDHWPTGFALLAGGGLRTGQVVGETDRLGERSKRRPYAAQNVLATLYKVLGIDPSLTFPDLTGRQYLLDEREPIAELLEAVAPH
jgi:hypothetical protein